LDIARCLYTIRTGKIIAKTAAFEWTIREKMTPNISVLQRAVEIRKNPHLYKADKGALDRAASLGPHIQEYADVLEAELIIGCKTKN